MHDVMGIINLNEPEEFLREITKHRPLAAVPFAGRYRLIDFILSSMVNSDIHNVGILVQHKYRALMDHLRSGKEWDLARKQDGLFILPPSQTMSLKGLSGDIENFYSNLDYIESSRQKYVLVTGSRIVCNTNFRKAFQFHENVKADITVLYKELQPEEDYNECSIMDVDTTGRVTDIAINPAAPRSRNVSMEMYIMKKQLLIEIVRELSARGGADLLRDGLMKNLDTLKMFGFEYKGYMARIYSIASYYRHSLELLQRDKRQELFIKSGLIYTKVKDEAPVKYKESAQVKNAMLANGCTIEGKVENSVLFRGVKVNKGAHVKNCIIMQKCEIGENTVIENVICDKDVHITSGKWLKGELSYPLVIEKGAVI